MAHDLRRLPNLVHYKPLGIKVQMPILVVNRPPFADENSINLVGKRSTKVFEGNRLKCNDVSFIWAKSDDWSFTFGRIFLTQTVTKSPTDTTWLGCLIMADSCGKYEWANPHESQYQRRHRNQRHYAPHLPASGRPLKSWYPVHLGRRTGIKRITKITTWFEKVGNDIFKRFWSKIWFLRHLLDW